MKNIYILLLLALTSQYTFSQAVPGPAGPIGGPTHICVPATGIVFSTDSIAGATGYAWTLPVSAAITSGANTNRIAVSFSGLTGPWNISVSGTNQAGNGISSSLPIILSPYPSIPTITPPGPVAICDGLGVSLSVAPQADVSYCWYSTDPSVMKSWQSIGIQAFSADTADHVDMKISPDGEIYVAFQDNAHARKASVMKYDGTNWQYVGSPGFSLGLTTYPRLAFCPSGQLFVTYKDAGLGCTSTVMKFDGTNWVYEGSPILSVSGDYPSLTFGSSGEPYVAFMDFGNSQKASVMKCQGGNWVYVGIPGITVSVANYESLEFSPSGELYLAFTDAAIESKASVMKYTGSNWINVGTPGFSDGSAAATDLAFSPSGQPYVAYSELLAGTMKVTVKKYDGINWVNVGQPRFSQDDAFYTSLAFNAEGQPCVAFEDFALSGKATVMVFDGVHWLPVGGPGFSSGDARCTTLHFGPDGKPYLAYVDFGLNCKVTVMHYDLACTGSSSTYFVTSPGTYAMTITNTSGCSEPSSNEVTVNSGVAPIPVITGPLAVCMDSGFQEYTTDLAMNGYEWTLSAGGTLVSGAGTNSVQVQWNLEGEQWIAVNYTNATGCSATSPTLEFITVNPVPPSPVITLVAGNLLHSNAPSGNQWYFDNHLILDATGQDYYPEVSGYYWDQVTLNGCISDTSAHFLYLKEGLNEPETPVKLTIFPMPNDGHFTIAFTGENNDLVSIRILNALGLQVYESIEVTTRDKKERTIDLGQVPDGIYSLILWNGTERVVQRIVVCH